MKKLIIAATIVCVAAFANASAVTWGLTTTATLDAKIFASGTAYFITASEMGRPTSITDSASATKWYNDNKDDIKTAALFTGTVTAGSSNNNVQYDVAVGRKAYWLLIVNSDESSIAFSTSTKSVNITTATTSTTGTWAADTQMATYAISSAPEPTSGLLLFIGLAGLALRRRRA